MANPAISRLDKDGIQRILFLGDSITQGGDYVTDVACGLLAAGFTGEVLCLGLSSESGTDLTAAENEGHLKKYGFGKPFLSERLERVLSAVKADMVLACYGMNDGSSLPRGREGIGRYGKAMAHLRDRAFVHGAKRVVLCTPPVRDPRGGPEAENHAGAMADFTRWLLDQKAGGWEIADIHGPMLAALNAGRAKDENFAFATDGVHPGREGHFLMAREVLGQGFDLDLSVKTSAEDLFQKNGAELRKLVDERRRTLFAAWMTQLKHTRPGVPGGPGAEPGPSVAEATKCAGVIRKEIMALLKDDAVG